MNSLKITKEKLNYLKNNSLEAKQVLQVLEKRRKHNLSVDIEGSSELSQAALLKVDLSGKYPIVPEGTEAIRDMPIVTRKKRRPVPEQDEEEDQNDNQEQQDEAQEEHPKPEDEGSVGALGIVLVILLTTKLVDDNADDSEEEEAIPIMLPARLQAIVDDVYDSVFTNTITRCPDIDMEEYSFDPLTLSSSEALHVASFKSKLILAEVTRQSSGNTYALRCYNTFLSKSALVNKIKDQDPSKTDAQVAYSLKEKFLAFRSITDEVQLDWDCLKKSCSRGKALFEFMQALELGTYCKYTSLYIHC